MKWGGYNRNGEDRMKRIGQHLLILWNQFFRKKIPQEKESW